MKVYELTARFDDGSTQQGVFATNAAAEKALLNAKKNQGAYGYMLLASSISARDASPEEVAIFATARRLRQGRI